MGDAYFVGLVALSVGIAFLTTSIPIGLCVFGGGLMVVAMVAYLNG